AGWQAHTTPGPLDPVEALRHQRSRRGEQQVVAADRADHLYAERQARRAFKQRQRDARRAEKRPDARMERIAGALEADRRLAGGGNRNQRVELLEDSFDFLAPPSCTLVRGP